MSLILAAHRGPNHYALAADSRATSSGPVSSVAKAFQVGPYLLGYTGALPGAQILHEVLEPLLEGVNDLSGPLTRAEVHRLLRQAHRNAVTFCGPVESGRYPTTGADVLLVCPAGIVHMDPTGAICWADKRYEVTFWALGVADGYALGWLDQVGEMDEVVGNTKRPNARDLVGCVEMAALRYPGVGGDVVVFEVGS